MNVFTSFYRLIDPLDSVQKYHQLLRCFKITDLSKRDSYIRSSRSHFSFVKDYRLIAESLCFQPF